MWSSERGNDHWQEQFITSCALTQTGCFLLTCMIQSRFQSLSLSLCLKKNVYQIKELNQYYDFNLIKMVIFPHYNLVFTKLVNAFTDAYAS